MSNCWLKYFILLNLIVGSSFGRSPITWVSDIDDTIKITHVKNRFDRVVRTVLKTQSFTGMNLLYHKLYKPEFGDQMVYLTGAPQVLSLWVNDFIKYNGFPPGKIILRPNLDSRTLEQYKFDSLLALMNQNENQFNLIGDDTQSDPMAYQRIYNLFPNRVLGIYVHRIIGTKLNSGWYGFLTAFDVAKIEYLMGRLSVQEVLEVGQVLLSEKKWKRVIPGFAYCPLEQYFYLDPEVSRMNQLILERIQKHCIP